MSESTQLTIDGAVIYADGSYRRRQAGWGLHGYLYHMSPLTRGIGTKQLPTSKGYAPMKLEDTVTPAVYFDGFGSVELNPSNNTGELQAVIEALYFAEQEGITNLLVFTDSQYVQKGIKTHMKKWVVNGWCKADGEPVANPTYWKELHQLLTRWSEEKWKVKVEYVKGHSGDLGNDLSDANAKTGSGHTNLPRRIVKSAVEGYHNPKVEANPLFMKTRMLFNLGGPNHKTDDGCYYYQYQLGRMQTYGNKQHDSLKERHNKTDLLLGRRIADATFCVVKLPEPDNYLEALIEHHAKTHMKDIVELAVARLDNAYRPATYQRVQQLGGDALIPAHDNHSLLTHNDDLITKTLDPPRLAQEAVAEFSILENHLNNYLNDSLGKGVQVIDITDTLFGKEVKGKNKDKEVVKLHKHITNTTPTLDVPITFKGHDVTLKLVLGVDIPQRNPLARLADVDPKVEVLVIASGPLCYSFATVFNTAAGKAIYKSPYTQFVIPKK